THVVRRPGLPGALEGARQRRPEGVFGAQGVRGDGDVEGGAPGADQVVGGGGADPGGAGRPGAGGGGRGGRGAGPAARGRAGGGGGGRGGGGARGGAAEEGGDGDVDPAPGPGVEDGHRCREGGGGAAGADEGLGAADQLDVALVGLPGGIPPGDETVLLQDDG